MSTFYPQIDEESLWALDVIRQHVEQDPDYLKNAPYPSKVVITLTKLVKPRHERPVIEVTETRSKWDILEIETQDLYDKLKETSETLSIDDHSERMSYFRTATSLLDKLVGLQERAMGLKRVHQFQQSVLDIMEDVLDPGQRTEVMEKLKRSIEEDE